MYWYKPFIGEIITSNIDSYFCHKMFETDLAHMMIINSNNNNNNNSIIT